MVARASCSTWPTAVEPIQMLRPNIFVKGSEFRDLKDTIGHVSQGGEAIRADRAALEFRDLPPPGGLVLHAPVDRRRHAHEDRLLPELAEHRRLGGAVAAAAVAVPLCAAAASPDHAQVTAAPA